MTLAFVEQTRKWRFDGYALTQYARERPLDLSETQQPGARNSSGVPREAGVQGGVYSEDRKIRNDNKFRHLPKDIILEFSLTAAARTPVRAPDLAAGLALAVDEGLVLHNALAGRVHVLLNHVTVHARGSDLDHLARTRVDGRATPG